MKILPMKTVDDITIMVLERGGFENMPDIFLNQMFAAHYFQKIVDTGQAEYVRLSQFVSYCDTSKIMAKTMKGNYTPEYGGLVKLIYSF